MSSIIEKVTQISAKNLKEQTYDVWNHNINSSYDLIDLHKSQFYLRKENSDVEDKCFPRYQLVRVKHSQVFSSTYLLQVCF